jgi:hypothetical protein
LRLLGLLELVDNYDGGNSDAAQANAIVFVEYP